MRCRSCGTCRSKTNADCWKLFGKCGTCAVIEHPEHYSPQHRARHYRQPEDHKKTSVNGRNTCTECGEVIPRLFYPKNKTTYRIPVWYCSACRIVQVDESLKILMGGLKI